MHPSRSTLLIPPALAVCAFGWCVSFAGAAVVPFTESTQPAGIFSASSNVETGTVVSTRLAPIASGSNTFTHWTLNGVRQEDASGRSRNPVAFTILEPVAAVAHYLPTSQDSDGDGLPDSYEIQFFGSLGSAPASDDDGDGFTTTDERTRGMSPVVANELVEGGVSRRRGLKLLVVEPANFTLAETSDPIGIINTSRSVPGGSSVLLSTMPAMSGELNFIGWYVGGTRIDSPLQLQPTSFTVTADTTVEARYLDRNTDSDLDGIPDWYERFNFGDLAQDGGSDSDDDGFTVAAEFGRSQSSLVRNEIVEGGISRRRSLGLTIAPVAFVTYHLVSEPAGVINESISVLGGSDVLTPYLMGSVVGGQHFVGWEIGGMRQVDASGASIGAARFIAVDGLVVTARLVAPQLDSDGDGVADWYELSYFGNLNQASDSDADGDGFDLTREELGGLSPLVESQISEGGVSRRRSAGMTAVNLQPFERLRQVLVNDVLTNLFSEDPAVSPPGGVDFGISVAPSLCDWDGDGDLDLFIVGDGSAVVFENIGNRNRMNLIERTENFGGLSSLCATIQEPRLAAGDWNIDGYVDLVLSDGQGLLYLIPSSQSFSGNGNGVSAGTFNPPSSGLNPALGDLNGDERADLLVTSPDGVIECFVHTGDSLAPFGSASTSVGIAGKLVEGVASLAIADLTLDGLNDVLASDRDGRIWEFHHRADGSFFLSSKVWGGSGLGFAPFPIIAAGDLEGDGDVDLVGGVPDGGLFGLRDPKVGRPTGLTADSGASSILLDWNPDWQSRIKGYHVYRSTEAGSEKVRISATAVEVPRYTDADLQFTPNHFYQVTAISEAIYAGNSVPTILESPPSGTVSANVRRVAVGLQDSSGYPGSDVRVLLSIGNSMGLAGAGLDLRLQYPPELTPLSQIVPESETVTASGLGDDLVFTTNEATANGELRIQGTGGILEAGQGKLFTVIFRVAPTAAVGSVLPVELVSAVLVDVGGDAVPVTLSGATVEVSEPVISDPPDEEGVEVGLYGLGDLTGDGWVNDDDLDLLKDLLPASADPPTEDQLNAGDTNGDGEISHRDLPGILRIRRGMEP